jgi:hypothetical protein
MSDAHGNIVLDASVKKGIHSGSDSLGLTKKIAKAGFRLKARVVIPAK